MFVEDVDILRNIVHYALHFLLPGVVAGIFFRSHWKTAWLIMVATMLVDLDHLLANPVFAPGRCSIGFHPLHTGYAIGGYGIMLVFSRLRLMALGLILHMATDWLDCLWMGNPAAPW